MSLNKIKESLWTKPFPKLFSIFKVLWSKKLDKIKPEIIIIGTGENQIMPSDEIMSFIEGQYSQLLRFAEFTFEQYLNSL